MADAAIAKAKEGSRKHREQREARERAERIAVQERQRAIAAQQEVQKLTGEKSRQEREANLRQQREKADQEIAENPYEWLKKQADELLGVKELLAEERNARVQLETQLKQERYVVAERKAKEQFVSAAKDKTAYPNLSKMPPAIILAAGIQIVSSEGAKGNKLRDEEILQMLEDTLAGHQADDEPATASKKIPEKKTAETNQVAATPKRADAPRTITSDMGKGYQLPTNFDDLPDRAQKKELGKMLAAISKKSPT
jgi:hypothetical protein